MAKESTSSSRIPRFDGAATRIPLPGSLRNPPTVATQQSVKSLLLTKATTTRPTSFAGLTPPFTNNCDSLKKSSSGERLNNAVNIVSKKTTTVFKKFFGKPPQQKPLISPVEQRKTPEIPTKAADITMTLSSDNTTPKSSLMRSETFISSKNDLSMLSIASATPTPAQAQSTPNQHLLKAPSTRNSKLNATLNKIDKTFNATNQNAAAPSYNRLDDKTFIKTKELRKTMTVDSPIPLQQNQNRRKSSDGTQNSSIENKTFDWSAEKYSNLDIDMTKIIKTGKSLMDSSSPGIATPATDATFSNPGSSDNLQMIEDVSVPSGFDLDATLQPEDILELPKKMSTTPPDKAQLKLPLNSTMNHSRILDLTAKNILFCSPANQFQLLNIKGEDIEAETKMKNTTQLLYLTQHSASAITTPDLKPSLAAPSNSYSLTPFSLKGAQSDLVLPTQTPDDVSMKLCLAAASANQLHREQERRASAAQSAQSLQDVNNAERKESTRLSFGMDLTECTLGCSIELVDNSLSSNATALTAGNTAQMRQSPSASMQLLHAHQQMLKKQNSFDLDESLGILTPDQMKDFLDSTANSTNNMELPLGLNSNATGCGASGMHKQNSMELQQLHMDQTPSPEELPLDPVEVKTDLSHNSVSLAEQQHQHHQAAFTIAAQQQHQKEQQEQRLQHESTEHREPTQRIQLQTNSISTTEPVSLHTDTELSKTEPIMTKSNVSKISTSFITSVTSVTSLDTGYQGDGEMSRPASRGASDHSPSNGPAARRSGHVSRQPSFNQQFQNQHPPLPPIRRQDPMTDSDFFTESDADDLLHRGGDRRAQIIDGQLYNCPTLNTNTASVFISEDPQMEDSCMESSGIFTDAENRCEEDPAQMRREDTEAEPLQDMSPDAEADDSTETVRSNRERNGIKLGKNSNHDMEATNDQSGHGSMMPSSCSADRLSAATTISNRTSYCSVDTNVGGECKSFSSLEEAFIDDQSPSCEFAKRVKSSSASSTGSTGNTIALKSNAQLVSCAKNNKPNGALAAEQSEKRKRENEGKQVTKKISRSHLKSQSIVSSCNNGGKAKQNKPLGSSAQSSSRGIVASNRNSKSASASQKPSPTVCKVPQAPNKWDVVMNKIANNKAITRKNYNDVKSKVSTTRAAGIAGHGGGGTVTSTSPSLRHTPTSSLSSAGPSSPITSGNKILRAKKLTTAPTTTTIGITRKPVNAGSKNGSPLHQHHQVQKNSQGQQGKHLLQGATKRGRSNSKDSQKSSLSDLSMASGAGSPKLLAKTSLRSAKKRDVRNLNISPTDLGPPPKAQQTVNGASSRLKSSVITNTQKRVLVVTPPQGTPSTTSSSNKSSSTSPINVRRSTVKVTTTAVSNAQAKSPTSVAVITKDSNRLSNIEQTTPTGSITATNNGIRTENPTELKEINCNGQQKQQQQQQQQLQHNINNNSISKAASESSARTNSINSLPLLELDQQNGKKGNGTTATATTILATVGTMATILQKKSPQKSQTTRKTFQKQQKSSSEDKPLANRTAECTDSVGLEQQIVENRHSCNGRLDFEALEQLLPQAELKQKIREKNIEAFGVLIQYLVFELDAFSCPKYKNESLKAQDTIKNTLNLLEEAKLSCAQLQDQLCDKEAYYVQREEELQNLHRCELEKAHSSYSELQQQAKEEIAGLENQLSEREIEHQRNMNCFRIEMENKFAEQLKLRRAAEDREQELQERLKASDSSKISLQEKLNAADEEAKKLANTAAEQERTLNARIADLTNELESLNAKKACSPPPPPPAVDEQRSSRRDKSELSHDEIAILRPIRCSYDSRVNVHPQRNAPRTSLPAELTRLESEVESLRCVLEMRQSEIFRLSKQNEELLRDAEDRATMAAKISKLNADIEMLKSELDRKTEKEKEYLIQLDKMHKDFSHEKMKRTRLGFDNEALQYQLKQRSEQLHIVEAKLHESLNSNASFNGSMARHSSQSNYSSASQCTPFQADNSTSPPLSPIVKGVIDKAHSVAYVLEIDDETPEIAASKMVKRASSFRSIERSPVARRQLSVSVNSAATNSTNNTSSTVGPNPLSQSMSAASVIHRQHSNEDTTPTTTNELNGHTKLRTRSRSVSVKDETSLAAAAAAASDDNRGYVAINELFPPPLNQDNHALCTSSPFNEGVRPRSSTMKIQTINDENDEKILFKRVSSSSKTSTATLPRLITCDTSSLSTGERLDERMLPSHPSLHDLKVPKQFQQIKESAGEAMVSGANSEDEGCSASSDDLISMHSSTSTDNGPLHILESAAHISLEQALLIDKINSLSGTPMEMSWSDEVNDCNELPISALSALNSSSNA